MSIKKKIEYFLLTASLYIFTAASALGQIPEYGSSPYSDQKYDPADNSLWYEMPALWIGAILVIVAVAVIILKRKRQYT